LAAADPQPVFDLIAESVTKLCSAEVCTVTRYNGEWGILMRSLAQMTQAWTSCPHLPYATKRRGRPQRALQAAAKRVLHR